MHFNNNTLATTMYLYEQSKNMCREHIINYLQFNKMCT